MVFVSWGRVRIWTIRCVLCLENWVIVVMVIIVWIGIRREVCQWMLFMRRRLVRLLVVCIVMLLGVYGVILSVIVVWIKRVSLLILFIMPI